MITLRGIRKGHPFGVSSPTDKDYADIANTVLAMAIERCFRHIANGRRNWLHTGSHEAAENLAFMYSLYESCKMNELDFGRYIEDILTRMKDGDKDYLSMLPCYYKAPKIQVEECA